MKNVCVFCGSSSGDNSIYSEKAKILGETIAAQDKRLVYGGGNVGLMGIIADQVMANGGEVTGIIPNFLFDWEVGHEGLTELIKVESMHERKLKMSELADGFIAMPGGFGTLEELGEILTWVQLSIIQKPIGILNVNGFYDHLIAQLDHMVKEKFLKEENRKMVLVSEDPSELLSMMESYRFEKTTKWVSPDKS
jgi:uncharacterized protein (TIGR00730 family)